MPNPTNLKPETVEEWKKEALDNLYFFDKYVLGYDKKLRPEKVGMEPKTHLDMCRFIEGRYIEGDDKEIKPFKLCEMPRGSLKSSVITVGRVVQKIIQNPNIRILITNEKFDNAKTFLDEIKGHFESNDILRDLYGDYVDRKKWTTERITVNARTVTFKEPTVDLGSLQVIKTGMHYDLIIMDDWVSDENIGSKEMMDNVIKQYKLALALLQPDGEVIVVGTRWHFNDLYNFLEKNERHRFNVFKRGAVNKDGTLLYPEKLTKKFLEEQRVSLGSYHYSCQYLNDPIDEETAHFKKKWIKFYEVTNEGFYKPNETPEIGQKPLGDKFYKLSQMNVSMAIDPSSGVSHDYTGVTVTAIDPENRVFVLEAFRKKLTATEIMKLMFDYQKKYQDLKVGIETAAMQVTLKYMLHEEMERREEWFYVKTFETTYAKSKEERIKSLTWKFEFGTIFLRPEQDDLIDELLRFPVGNFDDIADSLAYQPELWSAPSEEVDDSPPEGSIDWIRQQIIDSQRKKYYIGQERMQGYGEIN